MDIDVTSGRQKAECPNGSLLYIFQGRFKVVGEEGVSFPLYLIAL